MRALVLDGIPRLVPDLPVPALAPGEALVAVRVAGICDTDLQLARGYMNFRGVPGHEFVGEVLEADDRSLVGARVVADINAGCGTCASCTSERGHHCQTRSVLGILGRSGAFAEQLTIPDRCLVRVPDELDDDGAVFAEPLAAALHVLDEAATRSARTAVVLGDGKLGLLIALALHASGLRTTVVGRHAEKLSLAAAAGIATCLEGDDAPRGADLVVEATGSEKGLAAALTLVRPRGTVVLKTTVAAPFSVDLSPVVIHEITLIGSRCGDMQRAVDVLSRNEVDPRPLIGARYPLSRADAAFEHAGRRGSLKILVDVGSTAAP